MIEPKRILIIGDNGVDDSLRTALEKRGFRVESGLRDITETTKDFDLLVLDISDPNRAMGLLKNVRADAEFAKRLILVTGEWGSGLPTLAISAGADAFERKPAAPARLVEAVERLLRPQVMTATASMTAASDN